MIYVKIINGTIKKARIIHTHSGAYNIDKGDDAPEGWSIVDDANEINVDEIDLDEFPVLSRRQIRLALLKLSVTSEMVDAVVNSIPDPKTRATAAIYWQDTTSYNRSHPLIAQIAGALKIDTDTLDEAWMAAPTLDAE